MSHPNLDPAPPAEATIGRLHWHADHITREPGRYDSQTLAALRAASLALALAAGLPDEHRLLSELLDARAAGEHARVSKLAGELSSRIASWGVGASEALWLADREAASVRGQR